MRLARKGTISGVYCFLGTDLLYRKEPTLVQIIPGFSSEIKHGALLQRVLDYDKGAMERIHLTHSEERTIQIME